VTTSILLHAVISMIYNAGSSTLMQANTEALHLILAVRQARHSNDSICWRTEPGTKEVVVFGPSMLQPADV